MEFGVEGNLCAGGVAERLSAVSRGLMLPLWKPRSVYCVKNLASHPNAAKLETKKHGIRMGHSRLLRNLPDSDAVFGLQK